MSDDQTHDATTARWLPFTDVDRHTPDPVVSAATRVLGGKWGARSGVLRQWRSGTCTAEWQIDADGWAAMVAADAGAPLTVPGVWVRPGRTTLPREALTVAPAPTGALRTDT